MVFALLCFTYEKSVENGGKGGIKGHPSSQATARNCAGRQPFTPVHHEESRP
jgi:hypothetical protein